MDYKDLKLTSEAETYLRSVAITKLLRQSQMNVTQAWFETFLEQLDKVGYQIVKLPKLPEPD